LYFFFPAEDGIRDKLVTGVQTCALPICEAARSLHARGWIARTERAPEAQAQAPRVRAAGPALLPEQSAAVEAVTASLGRFGAFEIGRASCRERVEVRGGAVS